MTLKTKPRVDPAVFVSFFRYKMLYYPSLDASGSWIYDLLTSHLPHSAHQDLVELHKNWRDLTGQKKKNGHPCQVIKSTDC